MTCVHCGGSLRRGVVPFHLDRKGVHVSLDDVPAWVCNQCGEPCFDEATVDSMQGILEAADAAELRLRQIA